MSYQTKQRTRIEDLSVDGNELFELSEEMMMMVGGGYECDGQTIVITVGNSGTCSALATNDACNAVCQWDEDVD